MPRDQCVDCEIHYAGGKGLKGGRCPPCAASYVDRQPPKPKKGKGGGDDKEEE